MHGAFHHSPMRSGSGWEFLESPSLSTTAANLRSPSGGSVSLRTMASAAPERIVSFRPRTILTILGLVLATVALIELIYLAWHVITWILIAVFLAIALDPAVGFIERHGLRRGYSSAIVFFLALGAIVGLGFLLVPPLVDQVRSFVDYVPSRPDAGHSASSRRSTTSSIACATACKSRGQAVS